MQYIQSYEELLSMCAAGKANKVNSTIMELKTATCKDNGEEQSNIYSDIDDLEDDTLLFSFGQAVGKSIGTYCLLNITLNERITSVGCLLISRKHLV